MTALNIILLWYLGLEHINNVTKIKVKKKAADWAVFSFLKAAQIWSTYYYLLWLFSGHIRSKEAQLGGNPPNLSTLHVILHTGKWKVGKWEEGTFQAWQLTSRCFGRSSCYSMPNWRIAAIFAISDSEKLWQLELPSKEKVRTTYIYNLTVPNSV